MNGLMQDIGFAWRSALKQPSTSMLIVVTLALAIGVNSAMFSAAYQVLLAPLPYAEEGALVKLEPTGLTDLNRTGFSGPTLDDFREQSRAFTNLVEYSNFPLSISGQGEPYHGLVANVSWNFFDVLGVQPVHGRGFIRSDNDEGATPVLLLSHDFWVNEFGSDPNIVGTTLNIKDILYTVVGVLPQLPPYPAYNDVWVPEQSGPLRLFSLTDVDTNRSRHMLMVLGKLRGDVSFSQAAREVDTIAGRLAEDYPDGYSQDYSVTLLPLKSELVGGAIPILMLLTGLAVLVVVVACANIANINLARMAARSQELAIREAVGAGPGRIARQLLTESVLFASAGGMLGLAVAYPALTLLSGIISGYTVRAAEIELDTTILVFSIAAALLTGILSGSASSFHTRNINEVLKEGGDKFTASATASRRRSLLLGLQYSLSLVILISSALVLLSLYRLHNQHPGYDSDRVLAASLVLNVDLANPEQIGRQELEFGTRLLEGVSSIPEVDQVGLLAGAPLLQDTLNLPAIPIDIEGRNTNGEAGSAEAVYHSVSSGYFKAMNISLRQGRLFTDKDGEDTSLVAIINERFADQHFQDGNVVGGRIRFTNSGEWRTIVGVVGNTRSKGLDQEEGEAVYYNFWQFPTEIINLYARSSADLDVLAETIADIVYEIDPAQSIQSIGPLNQVKTEWLAPTRLKTSLISLFGVLALVVTLSGVAGVVSYNVSRRKREVGIHAAVGAHPGNIVTLFLKQGIKVYGLGLLAGLISMTVGAPLIEPLLYETRAVDPLVYTLSMLVLTSAVVTAMYLPARRASKLNPVTAVRVE